jgi:cytochrome P450 PksS
MNWFSVFSRVRSMTDIFHMLPSLRRTMQLLEEQCEEVRKQPKPGLLTALVQAKTDGDRFSKDELLWMAMLLLLAGHETIVRLISNSVLTLDASACGP